jgi:hypothetical protein
MIMTLKTLLQKYTWLNVANVLWNFYPDEKKNSSGYQDVFEKLKIISPEDTDLSIVVAHCRDEFDGEEYVDVSGKYLNPKTDEQAFSQAIEFTPWKEWLGMTIDQESLDHFSEIEIIAHCLHEMTFAGFDEENIQDEIKRIKDIHEDYQNMTEEEKKANTTSLDEFLKDFRKKGDDLGKP